MSTLLRGEIHIDIYQIIFFGDDYEIGYANLGSLFSVARTCKSNYAYMLPYIKYLRRQFFCFNNLAYEDFEHESYGSAIKANVPIDEGDELVDDKNLRLLMNTNRLGVMRKRRSYFGLRSSNAFYKDQYDFKYILLLMVMHNPVLVIKSYHRLKSLTVVEYYEEQCYYRKEPYTRFVLMNAVDTVDTRDLEEFTDIVIKCRVIDVIIAIHRINARLTPERISVLLEALINKKYNISGRVELFIQLFEEKFFEHEYFGPVNVEILLDSLIADATNAEKFKLMMSGQRIYDLSSELIHHLTPENRFAVIVNFMRTHPRESKIVYEKVMESLDGITNDFIDEIRPRDIGSFPLKWTAKILNKLLADYRKHPNVSRTKLARTYIETVSKLGIPVDDALIDMVRSWITDNLKYSVVLTAVKLRSDKCTDLAMLLFEKEGLFRIPFDELISEFSQEDYILFITKLVAKFPEVPKYMDMLEAHCTEEVIVNTLISIAERGLNKEMICVKLINHDRANLAVKYSDGIKSVDERLREIANLRDDAKNASDDKKFRIANTLMDMKQARAALKILESIDNVDLRVADAIAKLDPIKGKQAYMKLIFSSNHAPSVRLDAAEHFEKISIDSRKIYQILLKDSSSVIRNFAREALERLDNIKRREK